MNRLSQRAKARGRTADAQTRPATAPPPVLPENEPGRYRISRWRVEFSDGDTERRYRRHIEGPVAIYVSRMLVVWGVLWLLFGLSDYYQFGFSLTLYGVWAARLILFCGLLASAALVR